MWDAIWNAIVDGVGVIKVVGSMTALALGALYGRNIWKERKAREAGLQPNPTRCSEHETRLSVLEKACVQYNADIGNIKEDVHEMKEDIKSLVTMHIK